MKATVYTLGCKVNQYESQEIMTMLENSGYTLTGNKSEADVCIINSCTVTAESSRKTRQAVRRFRNDNPDAIIILTGCFPQAFPEEAELLTEADIILGNKTNDCITESIKSFLESGTRIINIIPHDKNDSYKGISIHNFDGHTRAFVKIQDGCNRYCSYCTIPKAKGFSRSRPLADIKSELEILTSLGYKEIVFVGINLSAFGLDNGTDICDAVELAENVVGIERIRLGSLEPDHITDEIISRLSRIKKFCPQFHLSLQSGSDRILKRMNRHYTSDEYYTLCTKLKSAFTDTSITTDIIVGFPGETEEDFNNTLNFAEKCGFIKAHVFPFSPRKGTPAYNYDGKINNSVKSERCSALQTKCDSIRSSLLNEYIGKTVSVLFETPKNGLQNGYTANYTPVAVVSDLNLCGQIKKVRIIKISDDYCEGILV